MWARIKNTSRQKKIGNWHFSNKPLMLDSEHDLLTRDRSIVHGFCIPSSSKSTCTVCLVSSCCKTPAASFYVCLLSMSLCSNCWLVAGPRLGAEEPCILHWIMTVSVLVGKQLPGTNFYIKFRQFMVFPWEIIGGCSHGSRMPFFF